MFRNTLQAHAALIVLLFQLRYGMRKTGSLELIREEHHTGEEGESDVTNREYRTEADDTLPGSGAGTPRRAQSQLQPGELLLQNLQGSANLTGRPARALNRRATTGDLRAAQAAAERRQKLGGCVNAQCRRSVVIIGGGPVGLFTGLELVKQNFEVTLLESSVYKGLWRENDHFTRGQILLVQDDGDAGYHSLQRLHELLPDYWWERLLDRACGPIPPPRRGTMLCTPVDAEWRKNLVSRRGHTANTRLSISIRELQYVLYKAFTASGGWVLFTRGHPSFVDHRGYVYFSLQYQTQASITPQQHQENRLRLQESWNACGLVRALPGDQNARTLAAHMAKEQLPLCWKALKHPNDGEKMPAEIAKRMINMINGPTHPDNCRQAGAGCKLDQETWVEIMNARELKPDVLICADGKMGECRNIVQLGKEMQKPMALNPEDHKINGNAWGLLFQVGGNLITELMQKASNGRLEDAELIGKKLPQRSSLGPALWQKPQNRFRAFPSRYYSGSQEDFYFAAALTLEEFNAYVELCDMVGREKCEGNYGDYPHSDETQLGLELACDGFKTDHPAVNTTDLADLDPATQQWVHCISLHRRFMNIFGNILAWTNVPIQYWGSLIRSARMSAFRIFFLKAVSFARKLPTRILAFAVGDAALDVHFFSGTGVNIGFKSATLLADLLGQWQGSPAYRPGSVPEKGDFAALVRSEAIEFAEKQRGSGNYQAQARRTAFPKELKQSGDILAESAQSYIAYLGHGTAQGPHGAPFGPPWLRHRWLSDEQLIQEYHEVHNFYMTHKHMDTSYNVIHAAKYDETRDAQGRVRPTEFTRQCPAKPLTGQTAPTPCLSCTAADTALCPKGKWQCLHPVRGDSKTEYEKLTPHEQTILDYMVMKKEPDRGTFCALQEAYYPPPPERTLG